MALEDASLFPEADGNKAAQYDVSRADGFRGVQLPDTAKLQFGDAAQISAFPSVVLVEMDVPQREHL